MMSQIEKVIKAKNMIFDNSLELEVRYDNVNFDEENPYDHQYQGIDTIFLTNFGKMQRFMKEDGSIIPESKDKNSE